MGFRVSLHGSNPGPLMSALGQKRTFECVRAMSALPPKADMAALAAAAARLHYQLSHSAVHQQCTRRSYNKYLLHDHS
jgi:hypothetical protein